MQHILTKMCNTRSYVPVDIFTGDIRWQRTERFLTEGCRCDMGVTIVGNVRIALLLNKPWISQTVIVETVFRRG